MTTSRDPTPSPDRSDHRAFAGAFAFAGRAWTPAEQADVIALVEGTLDPVEERRVLQRFSSDARALALIEEMAADRGALARLTERPAPRGLLEAVEQALEREALLNGSTGIPSAIPPANTGGVRFSAGVENGTLLSDRPPSLSIPRSRGSFSRLLFSPSGALAAAVLLLVGGVTYVSVFQSGTRRPSASDPIAAGITRAGADEESSKAREAPSITIADAQTEVLDQTRVVADHTPEAAARDRVDGVATDDTTRVAMKTGQVHENPSSASSIGPVAADAPNLDQPTTTSVAGVATTPGVITPEYAIELAREGRLLVRVVTGTSPDSVARAVKIASEASEQQRPLVGALTTSSDIESSSRLASVADAYRSIDSVGVRSASPNTSAQRSEQQPFGTAAGSPGSDSSFRVPIFTPDGVSVPFPVMSSPARSIASIDLQLSPAAITALRAALESRQSGARVQFIELDEPVRVAAPLDPQTLLWWTQPSSTWRPRAAVPVVFETK
jgi:hypothetical protein